MLEYIFKNAGIKELYSDKSEDSINRTMNIQNLIASAQEFETSIADADIDKFLQSVSLISDIDSSEKSNNNVTLATVHAVKGLEFKVVFVIGLEQKIFPILREEKLDEEERRLMYVAMTRAKERLILSNCAERFMYGKTERMIPSIFLKELGFVTKETFNAVNNTIKVKNYGIRNYSEEYEDAIEDRSLDFNALRNKKSLSELNQSKNGGLSREKKEDKKGFEVGRRVNHSHYGEGVIVSISGSGNSKMVDVKFDDVGLKSLLLDFAPLSLI
jgi:DNA helicase-2/ATP-dependent DNA helicase PcrA